MKRSSFFVEGPPTKDGTDIQTKDGKAVGKITDGVPSPSLKKSIERTYINVLQNKFETELQVVLRNKVYPLIVKKMPFVPNRY
jgi:aminomethyltransferase